MSQQTDFSPATVAKGLGVSVTTVRGYCRDLAVILSGGANPPVGEEKRISPADYSKIARALDLRKQGLTIEQIIDTIRSEQIEPVAPFIDLTPSPPVASTSLPPTVPPQPAQSSDSAIIAITQINQRFDLLQAQIDAQGRENASTVSVYALGIVTGLAVSAFILLALYFLGRIG